MAYIASSKPYYIEFQNARQTRNHLVAKAGSNHTTLHNSILIQTGIGQSLRTVQTIIGVANGETTANSYNLGASVDECLISLSECLKANTLFSNVKVVTDRTGQHIAQVEADMDNSEKYRVTIESTVTPPFYILGDFGGATDTTFTLNYSTPETNFSQSKTTDLDVVRFDIASPFSNSTFKYPIVLNISANSKRKNKFSLLAVGATEHTIMPTTLSLYESVDWDLYCHDGTAMAKEWLTRNTEREYNYGEVCCLSFLGQYPYRLFARYYTNAGVMVYEGEPEYYADLTSSKRQDYYFDLGISEVESTTSRQVGYVEVGLKDYSDNVITETPVTYVVNPRCHNNLELFFLNAIGGLDSFNGWVKFGVETSIGDLSTYDTNQMKSDLDFTHNDIAMYEVVHKKSSTNKYTLTSTKLKRDQVEWLRELQRSKYVFIRLGEWSKDDAKYQMVVVESMNIRDNSTEEDYTVEVTFHDFSNSIKF